MRIGMLLGGLLLVLALGVLGLRYYYDQVANPRVVRELREDPDGARAQRVMILTLPSGRQLPVNYLREGERVYAAADGSWWKELSRAERPVTLFIRGETLQGRARVVLDDPAYTKEIFARLRPDALPGFGTLVDVRLDAVVTAPD